MKVPKQTSVPISDRQAILKDAAGRIDRPLARLDADGVPLRDQPAQEAETVYARLATVELPVAVDRYPTSRYALVSVQPQSGRRHQIRRHLRRLGHPLIGDTTDLRISAAFEKAD